MPRYKQTWLVDGELMAIGRLAIEVASCALKLKPPQIRWVIERPNDGDGEWFECRIRGYCANDGKTVFLRHDLSLFAVADVAVHELRHVFQI